jgi:hypothetical protein
MFIPDKYEIVPLVTPESMYGADPLECELNSVITSIFIGGKNLPNDECITEARVIIALVKQIGLISNQCHTEIYDYLSDRFYTPINPPYANRDELDSAVDTISEVITRHALCL